MFNFRSAFAFFYLSPFLCLLLSFSFTLFLSFPLIPAQSLALDVLSCVINNIALSFLPKQLYAIPFIPVCASLLFVVVANLTLSCAQMYIFMKFIWVLFFSINWYQIKRFIALYLACNSISIVFAQKYINMNSEIDIVYAIHYTYYTPVCKIVLCSSFFVCSSFQLNEII